MKLLTQYLPLFFLGLAALAGVLAYRKTASSAIKLLTVLWVFTFLKEAVGFYLGNRGINNIVLYNIGDVIWGTLLLWYYSKVLKTPVWKTLAFISAVLFLLFCLFSLSFIKSWQQYQSLNFICAASGIIIFSAVYLLEQYRSDSTVPIVRVPYYWFCIGLLIYHAVTAPLLGMYNFLYLNYPAFGKQYSLPVLIGSTVLLNIFIATGFICSLRFQKYD